MVLPKQDTNKKKIFVNRDGPLAIVWEFTCKEEPYPDLVKPFIVRSQDAVGDAAVDGVIARIYKSYDRREWQTETRRSIDWIIAVDAGARP